MVHGLVGKENEQLQILSNFRKLGEKDGFWSIYISQYRSVEASSSLARSGAQIEENTIDWQISCYSSCIQPYTPTQYKLFSHQTYHSRESKTVNGVGSGIRYGRFLSRIVNFVINVNFISLFKSLGKEKYNLSPDKNRLNITSIVPSNSTKDSSPWPLVIYQLTLWIPYWSKLLVKVQSFNPFPTQFRKVLSRCKK